jgi:SAM-dependent methyltransferase
MNPEQTGRIASPSAWIMCWAGLVRAKGEVLDLACGSGRHARHFLGLKHNVVCVDRDVSGVEDLRTHPVVEIVQADLEDGSPWPLSSRRFAGVVVTNYLHRPLFPALIEALGPGGVLLYETFAVGNEKYGKPSKPDFLLRDGELLEMARGRLRVIAYEAVEEPSPRRVVQRIAAIKPE